MSTWQEKDPPRNKTRITEILWYFGDFLCSGEVLFAQLYLAGAFHDRIAEDHFTNAVCYDTAGTGIFHRFDMHKKLIKVLSIRI